MLSDLELLIQLQTIDRRISDLLNSQKEFPASIASLTDIVKKAADAVEDISKKATAVLNEKKSLEEKIADAKAHLDKSQELLNSIKTNREYDAVHTQIETFKNVVSSGDAKLKNFGQETEHLQEAVEKARAELEKVKDENAPKISEIKEKMDTINASIEQAGAQRAQIAAQVPKPLLRTYEHILKRRKNGQVLSFVSDTGRSTCSVCFKILEAQLVNEIRRSNKVIICQNCGSIFVWKTEGHPESTVVS